MAQTILEGKLIIDAVLTVETGLHIGGSSDYAPIGAVDSIFIRDPFTHQPIIPGSTLKGKMRTLLARTLDHGGETGVLPAHNEDANVVCRLFGASSTNSSQPARLQFSDAFVTSDSVEKFASADTDTFLGEVKFENTISRATGVANPRQIERVPRGMAFNVRIVYNIENEAELDEDITVLKDGFRLLQLDYLGGHGSRGYGRVSFSLFKVQHVDAKTGAIQEKTDLAEAFEKAKL